MATYAYTGMLTDFTEAPITGATPRLSVAPDRDSFGPLGPMSKRSVLVQPDSAGAFTVNLVATVDTSPETRYSLRCDWFTTGAGGTEVPAGWSQWDFTAAVGGGPIKDMVAAPASVWFIGPPWPAAPIPGVFYVNRDGDIPWSRYMP